MSDLLDRMIARISSTLPTSAEPVLPSLFGSSAAAIESNSEIVISNPANQPVANLAEEQRHPEPAASSEAELEQPAAPIKSVASNVTEPAFQSRMKAPTEFSPQPLPTKVVVATEANNRSAFRESAFYQIDVPEAEPASIDVEHTHGVRSETLRAAEPSPKHETLLAVTTRVAGEIPPPAALPIFGTLPQPPSPRPTKTEVHISIGQVEVRSAPVAPPAAKPKPARQVTLQKYLSRRREDAL